MTFPSVPRCPSLHGGYSLAVPSFRGRHWSGLGQTRASGGSCFGVLEVPWSHSWVPARDGTSVCGFPTWWCVQGPGCAEHCFRFVPDSIGFHGSRFSEFLLLWPVRDW
ncbi:hypothetical protein Taro_051973 [Colocasia esculenta]|uniref:Uncharacterized protein n=1 Tax=Colocasia esculenta TaxID=4460 RepID=A0A843XIC2_COLES|nr:hypothetical protein [Colocasia esculenta]